MKKKPTIPDLTIITSDDIETEIATLRADPDVRLAKAVDQARNSRRQYLYGLRSMKKKGQKLRESGVTLELLKAILNGVDLDETEEP
ncbi:MAG: hypothetical protein IKZ82_06830 [Clostridia bacterium]|nr:hypothetical protein [Clostridia bacterium]